MYLLKLRLKLNESLFLLLPFAFIPNNIVFLCCFQLATSSDIQIFMHPPNTKGVMLECHSGGWFPLPHMEWRDNKGEVIPATSKSHSQDGNKLFNMTMALFINTCSYQGVTCYLQNSQSHQEESISIILSGKICSCVSGTWIVPRIICFFFSDFVLKDLLSLAIHYSSLCCHFLGCFWLVLYSFTDLLSSTQIQVTKEDTPHPQGPGSTTSIIQEMVSLRGLQANMMKGITQLGVNFQRWL